MGFGTRAGQLKAMGCSHYCGMAGEKQFGTDCLGGVKCVNS